MDSRTQIFRKYLNADEIVLAPGIYDALTAQLAQRQGFKVLYVTGGGVSRGLIGKPDIGLVTMSEMVDQVRRIADAVSVPIFNDADTGYGNVMNTARSVRAFELAGSSGIHIEDQIFPKRCGHFEGKQLIDAFEMVGKIKAAVDSRQNSDFVIIARTDARAILGFEMAMDRAHQYAEAGADVVFVESPISEDELRKIPVEFQVPTMANMVEGGKTPLLSASELEAMGFKIVIFPGSLQRCMMKAAIKFLDHLRLTGTSKDAEDMMVTWQERNEIMGLEDILSMIQRYSA